MKNKIVLFILSMVLGFQSDAGSKTADGQTAFAVDLYKTLSKEPGNIIFSPFSISTALTMTASGAADNTLAEMLKVLHLEPTFAADYKSFLGEFKSSSNYELFTANRVWLREAKTYYPQFIEGLKANFNSDFLTLDFAKQPEPSRVTINKWVEGVTKNKIKDLIPTGLITKFTEMVLTSAIYFKGQWETPFESRFTHKDYFFTTKAKKTSVDFMKNTYPYDYFQDVDSQVLELPYKGNDLSFVVVLPSEKYDLKKIEASLSPARLQNWMSYKKPTDISLSLPKFKADRFLDLPSNLIALGMKDAFDRGRANFTKIRKLENGENIWIAHVLHKAFIEVNEMGTEAAAATAVIMGRGTGGPPAPPIPFVANRPFLYFIFHKPTKTVLFIGRFSQPN